MTKILMFPLLKRAENQPVIDEDTIPEDEELDDLADHYVGEIVKHMLNHNFEDNEDLMKDMQFVSEFLKSAMYRSVGKYHHLQEIIDEMTGVIEEDDELVDDEFDQTIIFKPDAEE